ncbi:MAG: N-acetylmuramoyl-L-alanine amidase [Candidatus Omnitrophica bacterium]|nr:N-acetylmuramoyl-L-alanine amidase [Candidatus Omnitrophota bacterium]
MKYKVLYFLLAVSLGCASSPSKRYSPYYSSISSKDPLSLAEFARKHDFQIDFDPFLKKVYLNKGEDIKMVFVLESAVALINNNTVQLKDTLQVKGGDIFLSSESARIILGHIYYGKKTESKAYRKTTDIYKIKTIVIDPGHGGKDPGAVGPSGAKEKDIVLSIARLLKNKLERSGYKVVMTRDDDSFVSLWRRVALANRAGADLFISIHANSARARSASGFEVFYLSEASDDDARALAAAENHPLGFEESITEDLNVQATIWDLLYSENRQESMSLARKICLSLESSLLSVRNRGVKTANFYVLRGVQMPAVLVEVGFLSNKYEESNLTQWKFKSDIADAITEGVKSYEQEYLVRLGY